jgi:transcriptional regulator with XRE-family HTH domain
VTKITPDPEPRFGELVKLYRLRAGLTQRQLARHAGLDFTYLSKIERSRVPPPTRDMVEAVAKASNLSAAELEGFVAAAGKLAVDLEQLIIREPEARRLLRSVQQVPESEQPKLLGWLAEQVERDLRRDGGKK